MLDRLAACCCGISVNTHGPAVLFVRSSRGSLPCPASSCPAPTQHQEALSAPAATNAARNKLLAAPLSALGLAFARLAEPLQQQHQAQLLQLVGPHLPHLTDKLLRKKLLQEPKDKLGAMQDSRERLLEALPAVRGAAAGGAGEWRLVLWDAGTSLVRQLAVCHGFAA